MPPSIVRLMLAVALLASLRAEAAVSSSRHKRAVAANSAGWRYYRAEQLPRAEMRFADAVTLDPDYALAHYNLACVASRLRDVATAVKELRWLAISSDPIAGEKRKKAATDPDLDFVSALPEVRALWTLPVFDETHPLEWLKERAGRWSTELADPDCATRSYTFELAGEAPRLTVREACGGAPAHQSSFAASVESDDAGAVRIGVPGWPRWPASAELHLVGCGGLDDAPGSCFLLIAGDVTLGPFHRGLPGSSPMAAPRSFASARH